jgi:hypothetical protein
MSGRRIPLPFASGRCRICSPDLILALLLNCALFVYTGRLHGVLLLIND